MGTSVISVSACSDFPFSIFWEFSGCVGPCTCAPAGIAINPLQHKIINAQSLATDALPAGCGARYLTTWPPPLPRDSLGSGQLCRSLPAILPPAQPNASATCHFYVTFEPSDPCRILRLRLNDRC